MLDIVCHNIYLKRGLGLDFSPDPGFLTQPHFGPSLWLAHAESFPCCALTILYYV